MSYYTVTTEVNLIIPAAKVDAAFEAVKSADLNAERKALCKEYNIDPSIFKENDYTKDAQSLEDVFLAMGFDGAGTVKNGDFSIGFFDNKSGDESDLLAAIAPFVKPITGNVAFIAWRGEDEHEWIDLFLGGKIITKTPEGRSWYDNLVGR